MPPLVTAAAVRRSNVGKVVEDVQQRLVDEHIVTTWPGCPVHRRHPLWLGDGAWHCERDRRLIAPPGELGEVLTREALP